MNQKNVGALLLAVATIVGGPLAVDHAIQVNEEVVASVTVNGPNVAEIGELVHLTLTGDRPAWKLPPVDVFRVDDNNVVLSFREPGDYVIIASASAGGYTTIIEHTITVLGPPEPAPVPEPDPVPNAAEDSLVDIVRQWCVDSNAPKLTCLQLGENFLTASNQDGIDSILISVAKANRKVNQKGCERVLAQIQQHLFDNLSGKGTSQHQLAFAQIGEGLSSYGR